MIYLLQFSKPGNFTRFTNAIFSTLIVAFFLFATVNNAFAQQAVNPQMSDFVLFSGNNSITGSSTPPSPGSGVLVGCNSIVNGGSIGTRNLFQTTGNANITGNVFSREKVDLASNSTISGNLNIANFSAISGAALKGSSGISIGGNIDVNGNTSITSGTVSGKVTRPSGSTYSGPVPAQGVVLGTPNLITFPNLPTITSFAPYAPQADINATRSISPGAYDDIKLPGWKTLTLNGTGTYIFDKVENSGDNDLVFDFQNNSTGVFKIYIHGDADFGQIKARIINGGSANRIYTEVHGNGSSLTTGNIAFLISNCSTPPISTWLGTVWAPYGAIKIGSLSGGTNIIGALWSGTQVNVRCGVTVTAAPYQEPATCVTPNVNAGPDKLLTCISPTQQLNGSSSTSGVSYNWVASNGGTIVSGATTATPTVTTIGTYTLTVTTSTGGCTASDVVVVTSLLIPPTVSAGADKQITCNSSSVQLDGSSITAGVSYSWVASNGGNIVSGATTAQPTVNAAGTYTLTVRESIGGCTSTDIALVTSNISLPNANAGADKQITCNTASVQLSGSSTSTGVSYSWNASNGGNIVSGSTTLTPTVNAAGTYTLKVTNTSTGCFKTDAAIVTSTGTLTNANAGSDKQLTCTATTVQLNGSSTTSGAIYSWAASNGGNIVSGATTASPIVNAAGTYTLTVTAGTNSCPSTDVAVVTMNTTLPNANAGTDKLLTCAVSSIQLAGSSTSSGVTYSWLASNGGNIVSGATTLTPIVNAAGTYTLKVTSTSSGCFQTDFAIVTLNNVLPTANAGSDKTLTCSVSSVQLSGSSTTSGTTFSWLASNGGSIVSGSTTATPTVNAAGTYTLTVTNPTNGCTKSDVALVTLSNQPPNANAGADKALTCAANSITLSGSSTSTNVTYSWLASNGGNIVSGATTNSPIVNAAGTYTLTVTKTSSGCTNSDVVLVTSNIAAPNANAGSDIALSCAAKTAVLSGTSTTIGATYSWIASNGGNIISNAATANPLIDGVGDYTLTVTNPANGCTATDVARGTGGCILLYYPKDTVGKTDSVIGSELTSLNRFFKPYNQDTTQNIFRLAHDSVWIEVIAKNGSYATLLSTLISSPYGMTDLVNNGPGSLIITGKYPIKNLLKLNSLNSLINYCRPLFPPILSNSILSKGDSALRANKTRTGFSLDGQGIKVGILSDSYNKKGSNPAGIDISNGNLPGIGNPDNNLTPVQVLRDLNFIGSDEGRAMAQLVHDVAPKASLAFRTGFIDASDFALGIRELEQNNCDVIVDDITYITEPFFSDGIVAQAVDYAASQGVSYFSAAGNFGGQSYEKIFASTTPPASITTGTAHNFGGGDVLQKISFPSKGDYTIVMQWEDGVYSLGQFTGTQNDLDIYLTDDAGNIIVGYNRNNIGRDPIEVLPISVQTASAKANLMIVRAAGSAAVRFKYIVFQGKVSIDEFKTDSSTIVGQANAKGAIAVGAAYYKKTPEFGVNPAVIESFSSIGGTRVNGIIRNKPEITAPDGGSTSVLFNGTNEFFGTSAAAPHAAGVAALMLQARTKFYSQALSPDSVRSIMMYTALDMGATGFDKQSGAGLIQSDAAILRYASAKPSLKDFELPTPSTAPGAQAFTVTINGEYMTNNSKVLLNGVQLPTTVISSKKITAVVPTFVGNPPLQVNNPTTVPNNNDGGESNKLYFTPLKKVVVKADDLVKKYGEALPTAFAHTITVDGVPLATSGLTLADIGLTSILDSTSATSTSPAMNSYYIRPYRAVAFNPSNAVDSVLLSIYDYSFLEGSCKVNKMPLKITPRDTAMVYGSEIDGQKIKFDYSFDNSNIASSDLSALTVAIKNTHASLLTDAVAFADGRITNGTGKVITNVDLENLSLVASGQSITGGRVIVNSSITNAQTTLIDIAPQTIYDYNSNSEKAVLISPFAGIIGRGLLSGGSIANGTGKVITNGTGKVITNGTGKVITNGTGKVITNGFASDTSNSNLAVLFDSLDANNPAGNDISELKSINLITGTTVGNWSIVPGAMLSDDFEISYGIGKLTITKAQLTITADNKSRDYGTTNPVFTASYSGFVNGDNISSITPPVISCTATPLTPAGTYPSLIKVNGGLAENYTLIKVTGTLTVKKFALTAIADNQTRLYGAANPNFSISYSGFKNGENVSAIQTLPVASTTATVQSNVGTYPISLSGGTANNYTFNFTSGTLTINKASLIATANNLTKIYGSSNPTLTISYSGFLNGDVSSNITKPTASTTAVKLSNVGTYPITLSGGTSTNYSIQKVNGTLTITPAGLSVKADNKSIAANASLPSFTYSAIGFVTGGANTILSGPQYTVSPVYTGAVGTYSIMPSALVLSQPNNYSITYIAGTLTVSLPNSNLENIELELDCVDTLINDASGFKYIARFEYENENCTSITIPVGSDNSLTGNYSGTQPTTFLPGEHHVNIKFDGNLLTWVVKSYDGSIKKTSTASASKNSRKCYCSSSRLANFSIVANENEAIEQSYSLFPNPASAKIYLVSAAEISEQTSISVYDMLGKVQEVKILQLSAENKIELDLTRLSKGFYFVRIDSNNSQETLRFVKE